MNNVPFASRLRFSSEVHTLFAFKMLSAMMSALTLFSAFCHTVVSLAKPHRRTYGQRPRCPDMELAEILGPNTCISRAATKHSAEASTTSSFRLSLSLVGNGNLSMLGKMVLPAVSARIN